MLEILDHPNKTDIFEIVVLKLDIKMKKKNCNMG